MRYVAAKYVPRLLNFDQKQSRVDITQEMLDLVRDDPDLLQWGISSVDSWVYVYDVIT